jgi:hypothetical protein
MKEELKQLLLETGAFRTGDFTLSSGKNPLHFLSTFPVRRQHAIRIGHYTISGDQRNFSQIEPIAKFTKKCHPPIFYIFCLQYTYS